MASPPTPGDDDARGRRPPELGRWGFTAFAWAVAGAVLAVSAPPAAALLAWAWPRTGTGVLWGAMAKALVLYLAFLVYGLTLLAVIVVVSRLLPVRPGRYAHTPRLLPFVVRNLLILLARLAFLPFLRASPLLPTFYRLLGARVGRGVAISSVHVLDPPMLTLGDGAVLGGSCHVLGHYGTAGEVVLGPVVIGPRALVGEAAIVFPNTTIGEGAVVRAGSVVPPGTTIPPGEVWEGVPARPRGKGEDDGEGARLLPREP